MLSRLSAVKVLFISRTLQLLFWFLLKCSQFVLKVFSFLYHSRVALFLFLLFTYMRTKIYKDCSYSFAYPFLMLIFVYSKDYNHLLALLFIFLLLYLQMCIRDSCCLSHFTGRIVRHSIYYEHSLLPVVWPKRLALYSIKHSTTAFQPGSFKYGNYSDTGRESLRTSCLLYTSRCV